MALPLFFSYIINIEQHVIVENLLANVDHHVFCLDAFLGVVQYTQEVNQRYRG